MLDPAAMIAKARKARALGADIVLGVMHAGDEYANVPNEQQRSVAHALVDSGQFTHDLRPPHPSVPPMERYKGTWIAYGLGNGVTELSPWYVVNNEGLLVRAQFSQDAAGKWSASDLARRRRHCARALPVVLGRHRRPAGALRRCRRGRGHPAADPDRGGIDGRCRGGRP